MSFLILDPPIKRRKLTLAQRVIGGWLLNEAAGDRLDIGGAGICDMTPFSTVTAAAGKFGNAVQLLLADTAYLQNAAPPASHRMPTSAWSAMAWLYPLTIGGVGVYRHMYEVGPGASRGFSLRVSYTGEVAFTVRGTGAYIVHAAVTLNQWNLIIGTYDPVTARIQVSSNGDADTASLAAPSFNPAQAGDVATIGGAIVAQTYDGLLDDIFLFRGALTSTERIELWNDGYGQAYPWTAGPWWRGNETIADSYVKNHVHLPANGNSAGVTIAATTPWTIAFRTTEETPDASDHYVIDSQTGVFTVGYNVAKNGFKVGATWYDIALIAAGDHSYFLICNGSTVQAYRDNVAVGAPVACTVGLGGSTRWRSRQNSTTTFKWNPAVTNGAIYNVALDAVQRAALHTTLMS